MVEIKPYRCEDALELLKDPVDIAWAKLNEVAGPGFTGMINGKVIACGGIRIYGVGTGWAVFSSEAKEMKKELLRQVRIKFKEIIKSANLWEIYAATRDITPQQANFLEHLNFEKNECYIHRG